MIPAAPARGPALLLALALGACRTPPPAAPGLREVAPAAVDETMLDRAVSPCDDFYRFACGGWIARTEIPPDRGRWVRSFDEIEERVEGQLRAILEASAAGQAFPRDHQVGKAGDFYAACRDEAAVEARGLEDLRAEWARVDAVRDAPSLEKELARLHARGIFPLFAFGSIQDFRDATRVIAVVAQGGLSLPDRDWYLRQDPRSQEIRTLFEKHVRRMLALAGVAPARAEADAAAVVGLERSLAETHWTRVEMRDPVRIYNRTDLAGLAREAPAFPWAAYAADMGRPDLGAVTVTTPRFLARLGQLVSSIPAETWRAYLRWQLLSAMAEARALPRAFVDERFAFESAAYTGASEMRPRWKHCVAMTDAALGEALGSAYVRLHFGADGKERTERLVAEVEAAMGRDLRGLDWMDEPTRRAALEKLGRVANKVGYPEVWRDYGPLQVDRSSFFRSLLAANAFEVRRDLDKIGKPVNRREWEMSPPTVNAYYSALLNQMVFPAGILQPPFFAKEAPEALNTGAIGMVVGHELTHGFDDKGRKFDGEGNLRDWWSPAVAAEFERRAACLVRQYGRYRVEGGVAVNGELTLGENIADLGGLKLAFAAHRAASAARPEPARGPFAPDQLFFLGHAQAWCAKTRPEEARRLALTDPHSPAEYRVNGPLANLPEFAEAFRCPAGCPMAPPPAERCAVW